MLCAALALCVGAAIGHSQASRGHASPTAHAGSIGAPVPERPAASVPLETGGGVTLEAEATPAPEPPHAPVADFDPHPPWLANLQPIDLPIGRPDRVALALQWLTGTEKGREFAISAIRRSGRYAPEIAKRLHDRHLPRALLAVAFAESGFRADATSKAGAAGLWQLMPAAAEDAGLVVAEHYDERRGVERATEAALGLLESLHVATGTWELALAAYDLGLARLKKTIARTGVDDYWVLSGIDGALPDETRGYVPMILACALLLENLDAFGLEGVEREPARSATDLEVPGGTKLAVVARAAGTSLVALRALNPEVLSGDVVPDEAKTLHLPADGLSRARVMLPTLLASADPWTLSVPADFDWGGDGDPRQPWRKKRSKPGTKDRSSLRPWLGRVVH